MFNIMKLLSLIASLEFDEQFFFFFSSFSEWNDDQFFNDTPNIWFMANLENYDNRKMHRNQVTQNKVVEHHNATINNQI